jgi:hypothetical protein
VVHLADVRALANDHFAPESVVLFESTFEPGADMGLPGNAHGATAGHSSRCFRNSLVTPVSRRCRRVVVRTVTPRKGVTLARMAVNGRIRLFCKRRLDWSLRRLRDEFVLLAEAKPYFQKTGSALLQNTVAAEFLRSSRGHQYRDLNLKSPIRP